MKPPRADKLDPRSRMHRKMARRLRALACPLAHEILDLEEDVLHECRVTLTDIMGDTQSRNIVLAREQLAWELRSFGLSLPQIGSLMGKHHTAAMLMIRAWSCEHGPPEIPMGRSLASTMWRYHRWPHRRTFGVLPVVKSEAFCTSRSRRNPKDPSSSCLARDAVDEPH